MFKELELIDADRLMAMENIQANKAKASKLYNKKIRPKQFADEDLVWKVILPFGTKNSKFGKWSLNWEGPFIVSKVIYGGTYKLVTLKRDELAGSINEKYLKKYYRTLWKEINIYNAQGC